MPPSVLAGSSSLVGSQMLGVGAVGGTASVRSQRAPVAPLPGPVAPGGVGTGSSASSSSFQSSPDLAVLVAALALAVLGSVLFLFPPAPLRPADFISLLARPV